MMAVDTSSTTQRLFEVTTPTSGVSTTEGSNPDEDEGRVERELQGLMITLVGLLANIGAVCSLLRKTIDISQQIRVHLLSIAMGDFAMTLTFTIRSLIIVATTGDQFTVGLCRLVYIVGMFCACSNPAMMLVLALDRLYALARPFQYRAQTQPVKKALVRVGVALVVTTIVVLMLFIDAPSPTPRCLLFEVISSRGMITAGFTTALYGGASAAIYLFLMCSIKVFRHDRFSQLTAKVQPLAPLAAIITAHKQELSRRQLEKSRRLTVRSGVFLVWYVISYLPFGCYLAYLGTLETTGVMQQTMQPHFTWLTVSPYLNGIVDPFLILWHVGMFARFKRCLVRKCSGTHTEPTTENNVTGVSVMEPYVDPTQIHPHKSVVPRAATLPGYTIHNTR